MEFKEVLLSDKVDLDVILLSLLAGVDPQQNNLSFVTGSASSEKRRDRNCLCIEVGSGLTANNTFDHHGDCSSPLQSRLSAAAQYFERIAVVVRYVDDVDRGELERVSKVGFPSLVQLVSGMQLMVQEPAKRLEFGQEIFRTILWAGINPYEQSMETILDYIPQARSWAEAKRVHEAKFTEVLEQAIFYKTQGGRKLGVIETTWIGSPGALYGVGCDLVIAFNPAHQIHGRTIRKYTVASQRVKGISLLPDALSAIESLELLKGGIGGWGGPDHGTIIGSPQNHDSALEMDDVVQVLVSMF